MTSTSTHTVPLTARIAGALAITISVVVGVTLPIRDVDLNVVNGWTLVLGAIGGALALSATSRVRCLTSVAVIALAAFPALFGWVGWLYVPAIGPLVVAIAGSDQGG
jgi:hypothetical protein